MFLSSYRNTNGSFGEGEMLWEHEPQVSVSTALSSSPKLLRLFLFTNRFHVVVRLFSNRSQMTSKCGKNKKVAHEAIAECVTDFLITF